MTLTRKEWGWYWRLIEEGLMTPHEARGFIRYCRRERKLRVNLKWWHELRKKPPKPVDGERLCDACRAGECLCCDGGSCQCACADLDRKMIPVIPMEIAMEMCG